MKLGALILYIGIVLIIFWVLGLILKMAGFLLHAALVVGVVLVVIGSIQRFFAGKGEG